MPANPTHPMLDIDALRKRHKELEKLKTTEEANLKNAEDNLRDLKNDALSKYGTDDLDALRQKLNDMEADNERKRAEYQAHLESIQDKLEEVRKQFGAEGA